MFKKITIKVEKTVCGNDTRTHRVHKRLTTRGSVLHRTRSTDENTRCGEGREGNTVLRRRPIHTARTRLRQNITAVWSSFSTRLPPRAFPPRVVKTLVNLCACTYASVRVYASSKAEESGKTWEKIPARLYREKKKRKSIRPNRVRNGNHITILYYTFILFFYL